MKLELKDYDFDGWFREEELDDEEALNDMLPLEGDEEELKERKELKILINKTINRTNKSRK